MELVEETPAPGIEENAAAAREDEQAQPPENA